MIANCAFEWPFAQMRTSMSLKLHTKNEHFSSPLNRSPEQNPLYEYMEYIHSMMRLSQISFHRAHIHIVSHHGAFYALSNNFWRKFRSYTHHRYIVHLGYVCGRVGVDYA